VTLLVDTSVWSLALRHDRPAAEPEVDELGRALEGSEQVVTTGLILQELLQGFHGARDRRRIVDRFAALPLVVPSRDDHVAAAELRTTCRRRGVQIGTIDALLAELCIRHELTMLTTDADFRHVAAHTPLRLWRA
jgi:hypothetical protein